MFKKCQKRNFANPVTFSQKCFFYLSSIAPIVFLVTFIAFAQSGKSNLETPDLKKTNLLLDSNSDKYKLVFSSSYEGKINWKFSEFDQMIKSKRLSLFEQINLAGEQGYKIMSFVSNYPVVLVKLDEAQYEYDWFETVSSFHFAKSDFKEKLENKLEKGFRVIDHSLVSRDCQFMYAENPEYGEKCRYLDLFLLEKVKGINKKIEQTLISSFPGWGAKPSVELESQIEKKLTEGFYPGRIISAFEILLERTKDKDDLLNNKPDVQVVRTSWGKGNLEEKVNQLAKQGYRLAMTNNRIAVLYRNEETKDIPVRYIWLRADKEKFLKELAKWQKQGVTYKTTYPNAHGTENTLIFEQQLKEDGSRSEFKVLNFEFDFTENKTEGRVYMDLKPKSKEAVKQMNQLVKEGFAVRDLFEAKNISVILERKK